MLNSFVVIDENYKEINCEVMALTKIDDKDVVVYKDENDELFASFYSLVNNKLSLFPINDELIYDKVDKFLEDFE